MEIEMNSIEKGLPDRDDPVLFDTGTWHGVGFYGDDYYSWDEGKGRYMEKCWHMCFSRHRLHTIEIVAWGYLPVNNGD